MYEVLVRPHQLGIYCTSFLGSERQAAEDLMQVSLREHQGLDPQLLKYVWHIWNKPNEG